MKMIYAIVPSEDDLNVTDRLNRAGYSVTKLATTGGFLRKGNTTLLIGTEEERVQKVIDIIKKECGQRDHEMLNVPYSSNGMPYSGAEFAGSYVTVDKGGATIFVLDVERYEKI